ncbi:endo-beta-1,4-xylanase [Ceratobasidium sp. AG-Ba]|nr:endo-beta-1,4-xylanase [Ceratobasidium sp. AG-Ba]QRW05404.1 endo-beta-1,4-xylanase [Ceratobasidium sp. AG-Ba]
MLALSALALATAASSAVAIPSAPKGLDTLAQKLKPARYIGVATESYNLLNATAFGRQYASIAESSEFGIYTPENTLKEVIEPQPGVFNFTQGDALFSIARKNKKKMRGHTLVWHSQLAPWVTANNYTSPQLKAILKRHVQTVARHYAGQIYSWDVVNEVFNEDGTYRQSIWYNTFGEDFIEWSFRWAQEADPFSKKYINDYNFEAISPKTDAAVKLVKKLKAKGVPIHGIGAQAHLVAGTVSPTFGQNLQRFADLGVDVALTELDIRMELPVTAEKLAQQAADYTTSVNACLGVKRCVGITIWQFTDALSWIPGVFPAEGAALPWDENLKTKPAYDAMRKALGA